MVGDFLRSRRYKWKAENIPDSDGKILYDILVKNKYKNALEIGTSTGHSAVWIAWALRQTRGKLITIEIDKERLERAKKNFKKAGVSQFINPRYADAHDLVKELKGPFDFVFCDADKDWYINYFKELYPKLKIGGCYTAHNVYGEESRYFMGGTSEFYKYIKKIKNLDTKIDRSGVGISISYKRSE